MRVFLLTNLPDHPGGLETFTSLLTQRLSDEFEFVVAGCHRDGRAQFPLPVAGTVVHVDQAWHAPEGRSALARRRDLIAGVMALRRAISTHKPDVLLMQSTDNWHPGLAALQLGTPLRIPIAYAFHLPFALCSQPHSRLVTAAIGAGIRRADVVVAASQGVAEDTRHQFGVDPWRLRVIHTPSPNIRFARVRERRQEPETPVLLHIGRPDRQKNQTLLLEAFARIAPRVQAHLDIIGPHTPGDHLHQLAASAPLRGRVRFLGWRDDVQARMAGATALVLCSDYEGFGMVLVEAMAVGCPVISTDCPHGPREILDGGRCGLLTPVGDVDALAAAMLRMLDDRELRHRLSAEGPHRAQVFDPETGLAQYRQLLRDLGAARRTSRP